MVTGVDWIPVSKRNRQQGGNAIGALVIAIVLMSLSVGICVLAVRIGSRPDSSFGELVHLHRLFGLPNPGQRSDWPAGQLRANRDEARNIASYRFRSRQRA